MLFRSEVFFHDFKFPGKAPGCPTYLSIEIKESITSLFAKSGASQKTRRWHTHWDLHDSIGVERVSSRWQKAALSVGVGNFSLGLTALYRGSFRRY